MGHPINVLQRLRAAILKIFIFRGAAAQFLRDFGNFAHFEHKLSSRAAKNENFQNHRTQSLENMFGMLHTYFQHQKLSRSHRKWGTAFWQKNIKIC